MFSRRETVEIIDKLIELTQHQNIQWHEQEPYTYMRSQDSRIDVLYVCNYINRNLRVYKKDFKYYLDDVQYTWDYEIVVEFVNDIGASAGSFPKTPNALDLYKAIQFQNPQIKNFYNDLFSQ